VLKARDQNLDRDVALKIISDELRSHPQALTLFLQEAKALAQLNHPNIVAVYDQSQHEGQAYMVMEFVDGSTLEHILAERGGKLPVAEALAIVDQLCAGLAYAHDRRVIHRDIKPANIFISGEGVVKIGDFGLARVMRELSLRKTEIRGTPLYMAPEQITGTNVGPRADLYAAGCTLFELVTGRPPFVDGDILYHHIHSEPPRPSGVDPDLSPELDAVVMRCITKDADQRIESAHALREQLRRLQQTY
jgi:eukaryotic-like serine/threonine-protein kinase